MGTQDIEIKSANTLLTKGPMRWDSNTVGASLKPVT